MADGKYTYYNEEFNCYEIDGIYYVLDEPVDSKEEMLEFLEEVKDKNSSFNKYVEKVGIFNIEGSAAYYKKQIEDANFHIGDDDDYKIDNWNDEPDWEEYLDDEGYLDEDQMPDYD